MKFDKYSPRPAEVLRHDDRYSEIYLPDHNPNVGQLFEILVDQKTYPGVVTSLGGGKKATFDFLSNPPKQGVAVAHLVSEVAMIELGESATKSRWSKTGDPWQLERKPGQQVVRSGLGTLDLCAPLLEGAVNIAFVPSPMRPLFFEPNVVCDDRGRLGFFDDASSGWDIFARMIASPLDALVFVEYAHSLEARLEIFRDLPSTILVVINTPSDVFPIVDSFAFSAATTRWVVEEDGSVNILRSVSSFEDKSAPAIRREIDAAKFARENAELLGEPMEDWNLEVVENRPIFTPRDR